MLMGEVTIIFNQILQGVFQIIFTTAALNNKIRKYNYFYTPQVFFAKNLKKT